MYSIIKSVSLFILIIFSNCTSNNVIISEHNDIIDMRLGDLVVQIDHLHGAKIVSTNYNTVELLSPREIHKDYYGSSLWLSPFNNNWPQPSVLDKDAYTYKILPNGVRLTSQHDTVRGLIYEKDIQIDPSDTTLVLNYTIKNTGSDTVSLAAWEVTRVPKDGVTFFPLGDLSLEESILIDSSVKSDLNAGILWHFFTPENKITGKMKSKLYTDGSEGWLAYVHKNILFIKEFEDVPLAEQAPGEKEIEIYVKDVINYIELENQSAYFDVAPGQSISYQTKWHFIDLGNQFDRKYLNAELVRLVRALIKDRL